MPNRASINPLSGPLDWSTSRHTTVHAARLMTTGRKYAERSTIEIRVRVSTAMASAKPRITVTGTKPSPNAMVIRATFATSSLENAIR